MHVFTYVLIDTFYYFCLCVFNSISQKRIKYEDKFLFIKNRLIKEMYYFIFICININIFTVNKYILIKHNYLSEESLHRVNVI